MLKFYMACQQAKPKSSPVGKKKTTTNHHSAKSLTIRNILLYANKISFCSNLY